MRPGQKRLYILIIAVDVYQPLEIANGIGEPTGIDQIPSLVESGDT